MLHPIPEPVGRERAWPNLLESCLIAGSKPEESGCHFLALGLGIRQEKAHLHASLRHWPNYFQSLFKLSRVWFADEEGDNPPPPNATSGKEGGVSRAVACPQPPPRAISCWLQCFTICRVSDVARNVITEQSSFPILFQTSCTWNINPKK